MQPTQVPVWMIVPHANDKGVDTVIDLRSGKRSGFKAGYDRVFYIGTHFPSTLLAFVRRAADGTEEVLTSPAAKLACALKAGENLRRGSAIVDEETGHPQIESTLVKFDEEQLRTGTWSQALPWPNLIESTKTEHVCA